MEKNKESVENSAMRSLLFKQSEEKAGLDDVRLAKDIVPGSPKAAKSHAHQSRSRRHHFFGKKKDHAHDIGFLLNEQFKMLKIKLLHAQNGNPPRTILVTSALPNEGKTTISANLATTLSQGMREHALLVDCDFKKADLHKRFGLTPSKGLADYLSGNADLSEIFLHTAAPKLSLVPVGKKPPNPVDLLASERMNQLIQEMKERYNDRYIIFDSSPFQITAEPEVLMKQMDGVIIVVRARKTNREIVLRAIQNIGKEKLLGVVLNGLEKSFSSSYYYNYYQYY